MIDINNITLRIGAKVLLEGASAHIGDSQKIGLIGYNGCGKSTLFRVFQKELETESGDIYFPEHARVAYVAQDIGDTSVKIIDYVLAQDKERAELLQKLEQVGPQEQAEIHERLKVIEAASAPARAAEILNGLGFANADFERPIKEFSGGWRMRLALAAALFRPSDILLLDEPTNHLDLEASIWLTEHLKRYRGTLIIISHDRSILNEICDGIIHFENKKLVSYTGNYDRFCRLRAEQRETQERQFKKQEQRRKHLESFVERFRYKATKAKQAQSRIKMLEKMPELTLPENEAQTKFDFPIPEEVASPMINMEDVSVGYDGKEVLRKLNLSIVENDRIALLGANGNGKSTFAKLLSERLQPMKGEIRRTPKLKVGYFAQHQAEELPLNQTPTEYMAGIMPPALTETQIRAFLGRFGLTQEKSQTKIELMSGGEKARLLFASISYQAPNLLILDEPTNHLDMAAREALAEALNEYRGAVVLIAHDLYLIDAVADDLWLVHGGTCRPYDGDMEDYKKLLLTNKENKQEKKAKEEEQRQKQQAKLKVQEQKAAEKELRKKLRQAEKAMEELSHRKTEIENKFQNQLTTQEIISLQKELKEIETTLAKAEEDWLTISEEIG